MTLSVRLTPKEEALLDAAARQTARSKSEIVRQGVRELCLRFARAEKSPFELGKGLFGVSAIAGEPADPVKKAIRARLGAKHRRVG